MTRESHRAIRPCAGPPNEESRLRCRSVVSDALVRRYGDAMALMFPESCGFQLDERGSIANACEGHERVAHPRGLEGASRDGKNLVTDEVKTNARRRNPVKVECIHGLNDVAAEFIPRISLCEDAFRQASGAVAAVCFLHNFKHQVIHTFHNSGALICLICASDSSRPASISVGAI